jgi:Arc/MetJ-type ribon-helix-helix transcriptional regulator
MATITFRSDDAVDKALEELMSDGRDRSAVIREAILAAQHEAFRQRLREESLRVFNDPADRAEIRAIQEEMDELRAW